VLIGFSLLSMSADEPSTAMTSIVRFSITILPLVRAPVCLCVHDAGPAQRSGSGHLDAPHRHFMSRNCLDDV
jgi:hypothetical protein